MTLIDDETPFGTYAPTGLIATLIDFTRTRAVTWGGKRAAFLARRIAMALLKTPVDMDVFGASMRLYPFRNVCEKRTLFTPKLFDPRERAFLDTILKPGGVFVDIGANVGVYTLYAAKRVAPTGKVLAIEPQPAVLRRLNYNIAANGLACVEVLPIAVADKEGSIRLFLDELNEGEASMKHVSRGPAEGAVATVEALPLTQVLDNAAISQIDCLKLDVEGAEDLILVPFFRDAPEALLPRSIIVENGSGSWQADLIALAEGKGYTIVERTRLNIILTR